MTRLGELDLPDRLQPFVPVWASQIVFGLACTAMAAIIRVSIDAFTPGAGPYALIYPAILLSTLLGRWQSGAITWASSFLGAWYFVLPAHWSFAFTDPGDLPRTFVNAFSAGSIVVLTEIFRRSVQSAVDERDSEIDKRDLFLREFDHRMKNNFMVVASLLDMQRRRAADPDIQEALREAAQRVHGFASAHKHLYRDTGDHSRVEMKGYLENLAQTLADALYLHGGITLSCEAEHALLSRDRAVSVGLIVNELVTNAVKHAFVGRDNGSIRVRFKKTDDGAYVLSVEDDGRGMPSVEMKSGLGGTLIDAFAMQAKGELKRENTGSGLRITLTLGR